MKQNDTGPRWLSTGGALETGRASAAGREPGPASSFRRVALVLAPVAVVALVGIVVALRGSTAHVAAPAAKHAQPAATKPASARAVALPARPAAPELSFPLLFQENVGQAGRGVDFVASTPSGQAYLSPAGAVLAVPTDAKRSRFVGLKLLGANPKPEASGVDPQRARFNYLIGNDRSKWHTNVRSYGGVRYESVYPGVDLVWHSSGGKLEYDFVVAPGADPTPIHLGLAGATSVRFDRTGALELKVGKSTFRQQAPVIYQTSGGKRHQVGGRFVLGANDTVRFALGRYDRTKPLTIDPLVYGALIGGNGNDGGGGVAVDAAGNAYLAGRVNIPCCTNSAFNFPTTAGVLQPYPAGHLNDRNGDAFVAKFDPSASGSASLTYATLLGGGPCASPTDPTPNGVRCTGAGEYASGIAVDNSGNAYVTGTTAAPNFPVTASRYHACPPEGESPPNTVDTFLTVLNPTGSGLVYSTCFGGQTSHELAANRLVLTSANRVWIAGSSTSTDLPVTANALQPSNQGALGTNDGFIAQFDPSVPGSAGLVYSSYLGTSGDDDAGVTGLALDSAGNVVVTFGTAASGVPSAPLQAALAASPIQPVSAGDRDAVIVKLNPSATAVLWATYLGGTARDTVNGGVAVDPANNVYVGGQTSSTNFPTTPGAFQMKKASASGDDTWVAKVNGAGSRLVYSTYLGGTGHDSNEPINGNNMVGTPRVAVDAAGNAYVSGSTTSTDFPTKNPIQPSPGGGSNGGGFLSKLTFDGSALAFSTYVSGTGGNDKGGAIVLGRSGRMYYSATGSTGIPATVSPFGGGSADGYVAVIADPLASPTLQTTPTGPAATISDSAVLAGGSTATGTITFKLYGPSDSSCATGIATSTRTVNGDGTYTSNPYTPTASGIYRWVAVYSGDSGNHPAGGSCFDTNESVNITKAFPTLTTDASAGVPVGGSITDTATLAGGASPTGTITFNLFGPGDTSCATSLATSTKTVSGNGDSTSDPYVTTAAGTYQWVATYSGDDNNTAASQARPCADLAETVVVSPAALSTKVPVVTVDMGPSSGSATNATAPCAPGSVLVGGGIKQFRPGTPGGETNGMKVNGTMPSDASGNFATDGSNDPPAWTAVGGFGGVGETGDTVSAFAVCATGGSIQVPDSPDTLVVTSSAFGNADGGHASEVHVTATCPGSTRLVGGGALGTPPAIGNFKPIASYPSNSAGVAVTDGATNPTSWTVVGGIMGDLTAFGTTTRVFAVCSFDATLSTVAHVTTLLNQAPPTGSGPGGSTPEMPPVTASCAPGQTLLNGGVQYFVNGGYPAQGDGYWGFHLIATYPSNADGSPVTNNASSPGSWTSIVHPGGISIPSIDEYAYVLCAQAPAAESAEVSVTKTGPSSARVGDTVGYTITVRNGGPAAATAVTVTDPLPGGVDFVSATISGAAPGAATGCSLASGTVTCALGSLPADATATITLVVKATAPGTVDNTATVAAAEADPSAGNNSATATTTVSAASADLSITKGDTPDPINVGGQITYSLTVSNAGPSVATGVTVTDPVPSGTTFVSTSASQGACAQASGTVTCNLGTLVSGASATGTVVVTTIAAGTVSNTATVSGAEGDPNTSNNSAPASTTVSKATPTLATQASASLVVGGALSDAATLAGAFSPTGTITYNLYAPGDTTCATPVFTTTKTVTGNGAYTSATFTSAAAGTYRWIASYSGDANNNATTPGLCTDPNQATVVTKATPAFSTNASATVPIGGAIFDRATLAGGVNATGTITFTVYGPGDTSCAQAPLSTLQTTVSGNGQYTSGNFTATANGVHRWIASYSGDANNNAVSGACNDPNESVEVGGSATLTTQASVGGTVGATITDTATLTNLASPTGTITFRLYAVSDVTCTTPVTSSTATVNGNGAYTSVPYTTTSAGSFRWVASYGGDPNNAPLAGACAPLSTTVPQTTSTVTATGGTATSAVVECPAGTTLVHGGARTFDTVTPGTESVGLKVHGSLPSNAAGAALPNATNEPTRWNGLGGFGPNAEAGDAVTGYAMCASGGTLTAPAGPDTVVVTVAGIGNSDGGSASESHVVATCPAGTRLVGGGGLGTPSNVNNFKLIATYPSDSTGAAVSNGATNPRSWTTVGGTNATLGTNVTTTSFAVCSYDAALSTVAHVTTMVNQPPPVDPLPAEMPPVTASCAAGETLLGGGVQYLVGGGYPGQGDNYWIYHLSASYPSSANGSPAAPGATSPSSWSAVVHPGNASVAALDEYAYALCAQDDHEAVTLAKAAPTIATHASGSIPAGRGAIADTATLSGGAGPTGTITFNLYGPDNAMCVGTPTFTTTKTVNGNGAYTSAAFSSPAAGTYRWVASYGGDANNNAVSGACNDANENVVVTAAGPLETCGANGVLTNPTTCTYMVTGSDVFVVPAGAAQATFEVTGAQGGNYFISGGGTLSDITGRAGGAGGQATGTFAVTPGEVVQVDVAGRGVNGTAASRTGGMMNGPSGGQGSPGGFGGSNGGIPAGAGDAAGARGGSAPTNGGNGSGGGGSSDVRRSESGCLALDCELESRVLAAGGGGGGGGVGGQGNALGGAGGNGGGLTGADGGATVDGGNRGFSGFGGTQTQGGAPGLNSCRHTAGQETDVRCGHDGFAGELGLGGAGGDGNRPCLGTENPPCAGGGTTTSGGGAGGGAGGGLYGGGGGSGGGGLFGGGGGAGGGGGGGSGFIHATAVNGSFVPGVNNGTINGGNGRIVVSWGAVAPKADLAIAKTDTPDPVTIGQHLTYTLTVTNNGPSEATGVTVVDTLPAAVSFDSATGSQGTACTGTTTITCNLGTLAAGAQATVTIVTTAAVGGTYTNTATVSAGEEDQITANNTATASTTINRALPSITTQASPNVTLGGSISDTATISGGFQPLGTLFFRVYGPNDATCAGPAVATLPVSFDGPGQVGSGPYTPTAAGTYRWTVEYPGDQNNFALGEVCNQPNESVVVSAPSAGLSIAKTDAPDPVLVGGRLTYSISVTNGGPDAATGVTVTDPLPSGVSFGSATPSQGTCSQASGTVTCALGGLANGGVATVSMIVTPMVSGPLTNTATVTGNENDSNTADNSATATTAVNASADLVLTKGDSPDPVGAGQPLTYVLTVHNNGPSTANDVTVTDTLPAGVSFGSASATQGTCGPAVSGTVACGLGSLASGADAAVTIVVTPATAGSITNNATVTTDTTDPIPGNNSASATTAVTASADVSVTKTDAPDPVAAGQLLTYTLTVTNNGPSSATGVTLTDTPPGGAPITLATYSQGTCAGTAPVVCNVGTLASGASATITIVVRPGAAGPLTNAATVSAAEADPTPGNNTASATTTVAKASPTLATQASGTVAVGRGSIADTATIAGGATPTGPVTFNVYGPNDTMCLNPAAFTTTKALNGNGAYQSPAFAPTAAGTYRWVASYGGDANNNAVAGACNDTNESVVVTAAGALQTCGATGMLSGTTCTYTTTGSDVFVVPAGVTSATFEVVGAQGGRFFVSGASAGLPDISGGVGGAGGRATGSLAVTPGETLQIDVAQRGVDGTAASRTGGMMNGPSGGQGSPGGFGGSNGGVAGGLGDAAGAKGGTAPGNGGNGSGGGGSSDVRRAAGGCLALDCGINSRLLVGGGGGGAGGNGGQGNAQSGSGGSGGGTTGGNGANGGGGNGGTLGSGGTQSAGGAPGLNPSRHQPGADLTDVRYGHDGFAGMLGLGGDGGDGNRPCRGIETPACAGGGTLTSGGGAGGGAGGGLYGGGGGSGGGGPFGGGGGAGGGGGGGSGYVDPSVAGGDLTNGVNNGTINGGNGRVVVTWTVPSADLSITKTDSPDPVVVGQQVTYTLTVANAGTDAASGVTVSDTLPGGVTLGTVTPSQGSCSGTTTISCNLGTIASGGQATVTITVTPSAAGSLTNAASVSSSTQDSNPNNNMDSESTTVSKASPSISTQASAGVAVGGSVSDAATLGGGAGATGTITFRLFGPGDTACTGSPVFTDTKTVSGNGPYTSASFTATVAGTYRWVASYGGDANNNAVSGACNDASESVAVGKVSPTLTTQASAAVTLGGSVSDTATLAGGSSATGTITFRLFGPGDPACTGSSVFTDTKTVSGNGPYTSASFTPTAPGTYRWVASYGGDANNNAVSGACNDANESVAVGKVSPTLTTQASAAVTLGGSVSDAATLAGGSSPTGSITFRLYGPNDATCATTPVFTSAAVAVSGNGSYGSGPFTPTVSGTYRWVASYSGDANNEAVAGVCNAANESVVVNDKTSPTIATQASAGVTVGGSVSDTATLAGGTSPTGTITFRLYGPADTTCAATPVFTDTRTVSGNGSYTSGSFTPAAVGTYRWVASYGGDASNNAAMGSCNDPTESVTVARASPAISTQASAGVTLGGSVSDTATLSGGSSPTGTITFRLYGPNDATCAGTPVFTSTATVSGNGTYASGSFTPTVAGTYRWVASYGGDASNGAVSGGCNDANESVAVAKATPSVATQASGNVPVGGSVTDAATVSGAGPAPTGTVTFFLCAPATVTANGGTCSAGGTQVGGAKSLTGGQATSDGSTATSASGLYCWRAEYSGDGNYAAASHTNASSECFTATAAGGAPVDLSIKKAGSPNSVPVHGTVTYTLTVKNRGPGAATGVTAVDPLPAGVTFLSASPSQGSCSGTATVTCNLGTLANNASATVTIVATASRAGTVTNTATVSGNEPESKPSDNTDSVETKLVGPDLALKKTASANTVPVNGALTYTVSVTNKGPGLATGVTVTDTLPGGVTFVSATASQGSCAGTSTVTCGLGNLASAATATVLIVVRPTVAGTITNAASVAGNEEDPKPANNVDSLLTDVVGPDLSLKKSDSGTVPVNGTLTYTVAVTNKGPGTATGVTVVDSLPASATLVSAGSSQGTCSGTSTVRCNLGTLANGASATITIVVRPAQAGSITNSATASANEPDPKPANNTDSVTTRVK